MPSDLEPTAADRACAEEICLDLFGPSWRVEADDRMIATIIARHTAAQVARETAKLRTERDELKRFYDAVRGRIKFASATALEGGDHLQITDVPTIEELDEVCRKVNAIARDEKGSDP